MWRRRERILVSAKGYRGARRLALLLLTIAGAPRVVGGVAAVVAALRGVRDGSEPLWHLGATVCPAERTVTAAARAKYHLGGIAYTIVDGTDLATAAAGAAPTL